MGCHTWFKIPILTDKSEILKVAQESLDNWVKEKWVTDSERQMYQYAIDNELITPVCSLAASLLEGSEEKDNEWIIYKDPSKVSIERYNKEHGTSFEYSHELPVEDKKLIEFYPDCPRIGGYPETIITNYEEMVKFVKSGYTDENKEHYTFSDAEDLSHIKEFFIKHPDGIITFG